MSVTDDTSDEYLVAQDLEALLEEDDKEEDEEEDCSVLAKRGRTSYRESSSASRESSFQSKQSQGQQNYLALLPDELSSQLLARLSAIDLTSIAQTCKHLSSLSESNELWRALYSQRWPQGGRENTGLLDQPSWKASYMERDAQRGEQIALRIPDTALRASYLQCLVAERHMTAPRVVQSCLPSSKVLWGRITRWRGTRGLLNCPSPCLGSEHMGCSQRGPFAELLGGLYMCETCGWAHLCGDGCPEKLVDEVSESLVCPISGRCFDRMLLDWETLQTAEEYYAVQDEGREEQEVEAGCDFGVAGHWGRAYSVGYNCSSEEELRKKCGIVM